MVKNMYLVILLVGFKVFSGCIQASNDFSDIDCLIEEQLGKPVLYCPWRETYSKQASSVPLEIDTEKKCAFCAQIEANQDEKYFILRRLNHHIIMLNAFPVSKGHLLIIPYSHVPSISDLSKEARQELIEIITLSVDFLKKALQVEGINVGFNLGKGSGASIPEHLHVHIVPRYSNRDAFYRIIGKILVVSWDMQKFYSTMKHTFNALLLE